MPRSAGQKEKLLRILMLLWDRTDETRGVTIREVTDYLSGYDIRAERKSVYHDFQTLGEMGFSVTRLRCRPEQYTLATRLLTLAECKLLADAVQSSRFIPVAQSRELIGKLERLVGERERGQLARTVYVENRVKSANTAALCNVDLLHTAIQQKCRVRFHYFEYNARKERVMRHNGRFYHVSPFALIWREENYYLVAYEEESKTRKHFRVDKMTDVSVCKENITPVPEFARFDPAAYSEKAFGMYGGEEELVTLGCATRLAGVLIDRFGTEPTFIPTADGFRVSLRVMLSPTFYAWVMGFGAEMQILHPPHVRERLRELLRESLRAYEADSGKDAAPV